MSLPQSLLRTFGFSVVYVIATYAGRLTVMDQTNLSLVWPAAGVSAVWFVAQRRSPRRYVDVLALSLITVVVNMATGASALLAAAFVLANVAQAQVFAYLFGRWLPHLWGGGGDRPLSRLYELWRLIPAAFLSTTCGALIGPTGVWLVNGVYSWPATAVWLTRNSVSILLIGTAGIRLGQYLHARFGADGRPWAWWDRWSHTPGRRRAEYLAIVAVSAMAYTAVFGIDHRLPLAFTVLVMTVWAGLRLHTGFVIAHDIVFGSLAVLFTLHGTGVFAHIGSHAARALVAQLFVGVIAVVGLSLALSRDERAALINTLKEERQAAGDQATLMSTIVDSMTEGLTVVDEQGRFLLRNPAVRDLMGGVVSTTDGPAAPGYYGLFHPDGRPVAPDEMPHRRALTGAAVTRMDICVRNPGVPDGRIVSVSSTALPGSHDGSRYAVTVFHDVTAERRHRDELTSFAGVVAHDLLNPLATVEGWTEALAESFADTPAHPAADEAADGLVRIRRAAARMRNLINDLLAYTTARDATITAADIDLTVLIDDIATARVDQAQSNGTPVPVFHLGGLHTVHGDPILIRQLLDNLISNAIKYVAPGVAPDITITTESSGDLVTFTITDNGIGIPDGQHHSIFDNFHRAHRNAAYAGTGLGLGICKRIVERHGGTITATDNPTGHGSRFVVTLPADTDAAKPPTSPTTPPAAPPAGQRDEPAARPQRPPGRPIAALPPLPAAESFDHAAHLVLDYLHENMPLAFWAVTRVENGRQVYLYLDADNGYGLRQGDSHPWEDSFCIHMAAGEAPTIARDAQAVPVYAQAGVNDTVDIGTYAGAVITEPDGTLFGAICGLDPQTHVDDPRMAAAEPLLALLGRLLTTALAADRSRYRSWTPVSHRTGPHTPETEAGERPRIHALNA